MSYEKAVKELSPCGLDCSRCASFKDGEIVKLSQALKEQLTNFERMAEQFKNFYPAFENYGHFTALLEHFSNGSCPGCRFGESACSCKAKDCHKIHNVDFCFQCVEYPCKQEDANERLYKLWQDNNDLMRDQGVESFYLQQKQKPRY